MCLAIPGKIVEIVDAGNHIAKVEVGGVKRNINIGMLPDETFTAGDWVIIHMGFVVEKTDAAGARAALQGLELMGRGREVPEQHFGDLP